MGLVSILCLGALITVRCLVVKCVRMGLPVSQSLKMGVLSVRCDVRSLDRPDFELISRC